MAFRRAGVPMGLPGISEFEVWRCEEQAVRAGDLAAVCAAAGNALEYCSGAEETPSICAILRENGALTAQMTGSGAAVFGVFDEGGKARAALAALKPGYKQSYLCRPTHGGPRVTGRRPLKK